MADAGFNETEAVLAKMEKKVDKVYRTAVKESQEKLERFMSQYATEFAKKKAEVKAGKLTEEAFNRWRLGKIASGKRYQAMLDTLAADLTNADKIAMSIVGDHMPEVYAINRNFAAFEVEKGSMMDTSFTLYDRQTVEHLIKGKGIQLPKPKVDIPKDKQWNRRHIREQITQGILQGEAIPSIAKRLEKVTDMDHSAAVRNARTAATGAQNLGRTDSYKRAEAMGIKMKQEWLATLDGRTRHSHRQMDGVKIKVGGKFPNGCRYPGDPEGPPEEVYNCRCTLVAALDSLDQSDAPRNSKLGDMTYEEWKAGKKKAKKKADDDSERIKKAIENAKEFSEREHKERNFSWDFWNNLSSDERDGVESYTGNYFRRMNDALRQGNPLANGPSIKDMIDNCESALSKHEVADDTLLYRGMGSTRSLARALGIEENQVSEMVRDKSIVGQRFVEKGFCSTGINSGAGWDKEVNLEIVAPKGTKGMYVDPISRYQGEEELLLQRGSIFEIYDVEADRYGNLKMKVVVVGNDI